MVSVVILEYALTSKDLDLGTCDGRQYAVFVHWDLGSFTQYDVFKLYSFTELGPGEGGRRSLYSPLYSIIGCRFSQIVD